MVCCDTAHACMRRQDSYDLQHPGERCVRCGNHECVCSLINNVNNKNKARA